MKFLDKLTKLAENVANSIEDSASNINKTYQEKGFKGLVDKTNEGLDTLAQQSQNYIGKISDRNKEILNSNKTDKFEDKIAAAAAVVVNTTQTIVEDVVKATKASVESATTTQEKQEPLKPETSQAPVGEQKSVEDIVVEAKKDKHIYVQDTLMDGEIASLNCTPLSIVIESLDGVADKRIPGKWKLDDFSIIIKDLGWNNFTTGLRVMKDEDSGAVNFLKAALNDFTMIHNPDPRFDKKQTEMALINLQKIHADPTYPEKLSAWMKEDAAFNEARNKVKVTSAQKEDLLEALAEATPKALTKRVRKPKAVPVEVETEEAPVKKTTRKKIS